MATTPQETPHPRQGRPRCPDAECSILKATMEMLRTMPAREISIEAIARKAKVGKTTIYRWWPNRAAILIDAFLYEVSTDLDYRPAATAEETLRRQLRAVVRWLSGHTGKIIADIICEGHADPGALEVYREKFLEPRRTAARELIEQGQQAGEFRKDVCPEVAIDLLYGPIYYRLLVGHLPLNAKYATALVDAAMQGLRA